ncbi:MAG: anti-sigma factor [Nitrososphaera sp.]
MALAAVLATGTVAVLSVQSAAASDKDRVSGDLTSPAEGNPFGGDDVGDYSIVTAGHKTVVRAQADIEPSNGRVLEGWFVDMGTGYKLSLGQFRDNGSLSFEQNIVSPHTYKVIVVTEEPANDLDPNPATPVGGAELPSPFGQ